MLRKGQRINASISPRVRRLVEQAADLERRSLSSYAEFALERAAQATLANHKAAPIAPALEDMPQ